MKFDCETWVTGPNNDPQKLVCDAVRAKCQRSVCISCGRSTLCFSSLSRRGCLKYRARREILLYSYDLCTRINAYTILMSFVKGEDMDPITRGIYCRRCAYLRHPLALFPRRRKSLLPVRDFSFRGCELTGETRSIESQKAEFSQWMAQAAVI